MGQVRPITPHLRSLAAPEPLRALPGWLTWRYETYAGEVKPRKVPYYTSGVRRHGTQGSPQDRAQLTTFAAARDAAVRLGYDGVGLAMLPDWQVTAIDVDHCVAPDGTLPAEIEDVVQQTYAEYSPSGTGIRAFFAGNLGNHKSIATTERYGLETFASSGFVTFTGNILPHVDILGYEDKVSAAPQKLLDLCQTRFGSTSDSSSFDPEDFMAGREPRLGLSIAQMQELIDALDPDMPREEWLRVGLALHHETEGGDDGFDMWDEWSSAGATYPGTERLRYDWDSFKPRPGRRQVTMATVIKMAKEVGQTRPSVATADDLSAAVADIPPAAILGQTPADFHGKFSVLRASTAMHRPPISWFIKGVLPRADLGIIFGASGSGKTFVTLDLVMALARGSDWRGHRVNGQARVLYIAAEGSGGLGSRVKAYCQAHDINIDSIALSVMYAAPNFMQRDDITEVLTSVKAAGGFDVIVVDTFAQVTPGANENGAEDMGAAIGNAKALREASDAMIIFVHHAGKDAAKGSRGWSGIKAAADVQIEIIRHEDGAREIHLEKLKDGEDGLRWGFLLEAVELGMDADGDPIVSCFVTEAQTRTDKAETENRNFRKRGRIENHILETMSLFAERDVVKLEELISAAAEMLPPPEEGQRDTRRQHVVRALRKLSKEPDGPLQVEGNIVIFYE